MYISATAPFSSGGRARFWMCGPQMPAPHKVSCKYSKIFVSLRHRLTTTIRRTEKTAGTTTTCLYESLDLIRETGPGVGPDRLQSRPKLQRAAADPRNRISTVRGEHEDRKRCPPVPGRLEHAASQSQGWMRKAQRTIAKPSCSQRVRGHQLHSSLGGLTRLAKNRSSLRQSSRTRTVSSRKNRWPDSASSSSRAELPMSRIMVPPRPTTIPF